MVLPEPGSFLFALIAMVAAFLAGSAKLAIDLIELAPADLLADAGVLVAVGVALTQIPQGNALLSEVLFVAGIATQALPRVLPPRWRRS